MRDWRIQINFGWGEIQMFEIVDKGGKKSLSHLRDIYYVQTSEYRKKQEFVQFECIQTKREK